MKTFNLDKALLEFTGKWGSTYWTIRNSFEGSQIFGGTGAGKTSGSGRIIGLKFLSNGYGGLVLTVKPDEKDQWIANCKAAGRSHDLIIVEPDGGNYFDFLEYESKDGGLTENIVQVLKTVIRASKEKATGANEDPFWESALDMLIFSIIDLCKLADGKVSIMRMYELVQTIPQNMSEYRDEEKKDKPDTAFMIALLKAKAKAKEQMDEWEASLPVEKLRSFKDKSDYNEALSLAVPDVRIYNMIYKFLETYMNLHEKTRSIIDFSFSGFLFSMLRDPIYSLFCRNASTFTPDDCLNGKIILLNLPVKLYHKAGRDTQIMFKYIWQRAMEKRQVNAQSRPVFLWADEAQNFIHEHDADFQATARSSRIATVYITQNLPNYRASMGGIHSNDKVDAFLGTLCTKIIHANADTQTNKYLSELIGDVQYIETSRNTTMAGQYAMGKTQSLRIDRAVRPEEFVRLKTGGDLNKGKVEAYLHVQGNPIKDGLNYAKIMFDQNFNL